MQIHSSNMRNNTLFVLFSKNYLLVVENVSKEVWGNLSADLINITERQKISKCSFFFKNRPKKNQFCIKRRVLYSRSIDPTTAYRCCSAPSGHRSDEHVYFGGNAFLHVFCLPTSRRDSACSATTTTSCSASAGYKMEDVSVQSGGRSGGIVVKSWVKTSVKWRKQKVRVRGCTSCRCAFWQLYAQCRLGIFSATERFDAF